MLEAIKYLFTSQYQENAHAFSGIFSTLWEAVKIAFDQLKHLPELILSLPFWAIEALVFIIIAVLIPVVDKTKEVYENKKRALWERSIKGKFEL